MIKKHKDLEYPVRAIRISNKIWKKLKKKKEDSNKSWNLFIEEALKEL